MQLETITFPRTQIHENYEYHNVVTDFARIKEKINFIKKHIIYELLIS